MTKSAFTDWDSTAANNEDIGGINIKEGCAAAGVNNAIREAMAQLIVGVDGKMKRYVKGAGYTALTTDNNAVLEFSGAYTLALTAAATLGANWHCIVYANGGAVTVDPNSTELIDGASTISVADGRSTLIFCTGTAFESTPLSPDLTAYLTTATAESTYLPIAEAWESVASATTTDLSATSSNVLITGTTTITGLGTVAAGTKRYIRFNGALTFTHNATSLILPSAANITTAANDRCIAVSLGSGNWVVTSYTKADGTALVSSSSRDLLGTYSPSGSASVDMTLPTSGYQYFEVEFDGLTKSGSAQLRAIVSKSASWLTGAIYAGATTNFATGSQYSNGTDTYIPIEAAAGTYSLTGDMRLRDGFARGQSEYSLPGQSIFSRVITTAGAYDGLRFLLSAGTFTGGTIRVYGVK